MFPELKTVIDNAGIKVESLPENAFRIIGKVFKDRKPIEGLTVFLSSAKGNWIETTGSACTNNIGYYSLTVAGNKLPNQEPDINVEKKEEKSYSVYLSVSNKDKKILYKASEPILVSKASTYYVDINLDNEGCVSPPADKSDKETKE